ncbi:MAG: hypoxanthine phosphoribosyltransferase [Bacteroidales bacterium]
MKERIKVHDKYFKPFIANAKIEAIITNVAKELNNDFKNTEEPPIFLSVLNGSFMFCASLMQKLDFPCDVSFIKMASYEGTKSTGKIKQLIGLNENIKGKTIIIIEDIVDSGQTINNLGILLKEQGAKDIRVCTLFYKPNAYKGKMKINYHAMDIENEFIVGFGLDYNHLARQYKDIYIIDED